MFECWDEWDNDLVAKVLIPRGTYQEMRGKWIDETELAGIREARAIIVHDPSTAEIIGSCVPESVDRMFDGIREAVERHGGKIVQKPKRHRDDSYSFYMADPDGNVIQILFEPTISAIELVSRKQD